MVFPVCDALFAFRKAVGNFDGFHVADDDPALAALLFSATTNRLSAVCGTQAMMMAVVRR